MLAVNSSASDSTGFSPCFVTQGREPRIPKALYDNDALGMGAAKATTPENAAQLQDVFELVRRNMDWAVQKQARHYNLKRRE